MRVTKVYVSSDGEGSVEAVYEVSSESMANAIYYRVGIREDADKVIRITPISDLTDKWVYFTNLHPDA